MGHLVAAAWIAAVAANEGITASAPEIRRHYEQDISAKFPKRAEFSRYQAVRRASVADELLDAKQGLLAQQVLAKLKPQGPSGLLALKQAEEHLTAVTTCSPGYVVEHCKEYHAGQSRGASPPAAVVIEQVAALATGRCTNLAACGKQ